MSLKPFFVDWLQNLPLSTAIRDSVWIYAVDQSMHLVVLTILAGAILIVDMRLLGLGVKRQPVAQVARDAQPWLIGGLLGMVATGIPQLMSNATKEYYSPFYWQKMEFLLAALIFTFTIRRSITLADEARVGPFWGKLVGLVSIVLWSGVAISGRLIGLLS